MPKSNATALAAFIPATTDLDAMFERLAPLRADHFERSPEDVNCAVTPESHPAETRVRV